MKLTGEERFRGADDSTVRDFWSWAYSDLRSNANRGVLAEYLVASALGVTDDARTEWDAVDLRYRGAKIEVKAAGYVQSWHGPADPPSTIRFGIARRLGWDAATNSSAEQSTRAADIWVFALHQVQVGERVDVLEVDQWRFHVVPTATLDAVFGDQKTLGLRRLEAVARATPWAALRDAVEELIHAERLG